MIWRETRVSQKLKNNNNNNEVMMYAIPWMNLENIMLSEWSQTQKVTCCMTAFIWSVQNK